MSNFVTAINVTLPLVFMLAVGYGLRKIGWISKDFIRIANKLNFNVFLPCSVFAGTYCSNYDLSESLDIILLAVISILIMCAVGMVVAKFVTTDKPKRGTFVVSLFRSNYAYIGIPVVCAIIGSTTSILASIILAITSMFNNILTPIVFSVNTNEKLSAKKLAKDVFGNTYLIATLIAIILMLLHCPQFPMPIHKTIASLGSICTPLAVVVLGANIDPRRVEGNKTVLSWACLFRLVIFPVVGTIVCILLGLRGERLVVMFTMYACPAATLLFTVSQEMGGDTDLATDIVAIGTILSMVTMTIGIFALKSFGYI